MTSAPASRSPRTSSRARSRRRRRDRQAVPLADSGHQQMLLRRAPNIWAFVGVGGVLGILVGVLVGVLGAGSPQFTPGTVILFMVSVCALVGLAAGAVVALVLERISVSLARSVTTEVVDESVRTTEEDVRTAEDDLPDGSRRTAEAVAPTGDGAAPAGPRTDEAVRPADPRADEVVRPADPRSPREG